MSAQTIERPCALILDSNQFSALKVETSADKLAAARRIWQKECAQSSKACACVGFPFPKERLQIAGN
jgi:hypothetical protein